jgi:hypothetical protein
MDRRGGEEMLFPVGLMEIQQHWLKPWRAWRGLEEQNEGLL